MYVFGSLVANSCLYCHERDFKLSLNSDTQSDIIEAFNNISRYLDDIFNIDNPLFDTLIPFIYPREIHLNKTNESNPSTIDSYAFLFGCAVTDRV